MPDTFAPRLAFSTLGCPDWTWQDILTNGPEYGFHGVEIRLVARQTDLLQVPEFHPRKLAKRKRELRDAGLSVCGLASSVRFDDPAAESRKIQLNAGRRYVDLASELGATFVRVFGDLLPTNASAAERSAAVRWIAAGLDKLGAYGEEQGIEILLETHGDFADSRQLQETMRLVVSRAVGVLWDTHHPWRFAEETLPETFSRLSSWVRHTHWKDSVGSRGDSGKPTLRDLASQTEIAAARQARELMSGHLHADYVPFGQGEFPINECLSLLHKANYSGWLCLEWEKMWHPELPEPEQVLPAFTREMHHRWLST